MTGGFSLFCPSSFPSPGVVVDRPIPGLFERGKRERLRNLERPEWQLLIPRVGHKGPGFRSHLDGGGAPEESTKGQRPDG